MDPIVEVEQVSKIFRTDSVETHALSEVSLRIGRGEYVSVMGRSGSGKSTLLAVLGLMEQPSLGRVIIAGIETTAVDRKALARLRGRHIGFVFQFFHLIGDLSVEDNIALPMVYAGRNECDVRERTHALAEKLEIAHRLRHRPSQLSGGQQQRVAIARALANDPDLLLVDEPTGNLDSQSGSQVMELLAAEHAQGRSVCLVTHDVDCASQASRHLFMRDGRLFDGSENPDREIRQ